MTTATAEEKLQAARARLLETLSGRKPLKLNAAPKPSYEEFCETIKLNAAQRQKLDASKRELVETLSHGTKHDGFDDGVLVIDTPKDQQVKMAAARREMHDRLAGRYRKPQKLNQCPRDNSTGAKNTTLDSPNTPFGMPFSGGWEVTARNGQITLDSILAEEQEAADEDSPSPSVTSGQGVTDWSPRDHQDTEYDNTSDDDESADPSEQSAKILSMYTNKDGKISKYAKAHFLTVSNSGESASDYSIPLSKMDDVSQTILHDSDALDNAFAIAAGRDSGLAHYGKMSRIVRIKQRSGMPLTLEQKDHIQRHMAAVEPTDAERIDAAIGRTQ